MFQVVRTTLRSGCPQDAVSLLSAGRCEQAKGLLLSFLIFILISSCTKDESTDPNPPISPIPAIELKSISPGTIHQLSDSLRFEINYTDGDGDLGDYDADTLSLWVTDNRFPLTEKFHIPPLAPQGTTIAISGTLNIILDHIILKDQSASSETATFTVKLKDRAGNWSNGITSGNIVILP
ncbi:MAG TPA: hypothetical protein VE978_27635 [Chitinophagales bacterium]|nr:hypothetical protein [Chitinophagales bacterium]